MDLKPAVLWIASIGYFAFVAFVAALILLGLQGRRLHRRGQMSFDPLVACAISSVILAALAISMAWLS